MNEKLLKIINHYGLISQLKYFQSEVFELNEAILNRENPNCILRPLYNLNANINGKKPSEIKHIIEEIADVMVMLEQFKLYYKITDEEVKNIMSQKIDRQIERIENENKNN